MSEDLGWTREKNGKQREGKEVVISRKAVKKGFCEGILRRNLKNKN